jgi:hydroxymethylbilane synthase
MTKRTIRIATRSSPLALAQTQSVLEALQRHDPDIRHTLVPMTTPADNAPNTPIHHIGGKGIFIKTLEAALLEGKADIAVHSVKDLPCTLDAAFQLPCVLPRAPAHDVLIGKKPYTLSTLPSGSIVGTSSIRRRHELLLMRPDIQCQDIRGNVGTRIDKLQQGYDAIILAYAGVERLGLTQHIHEHCRLDQLLPAAGQAAIGIECRTEDSELITYLAALNHEPTATCIESERAVMRALGAHCFAPVAAHATYADDLLQVTARVIGRRGSIEVQVSGSAHQATELGERAAESLRQQGALAIIEATTRGA